MSSTEQYSGLNDQRSSSRVLKPPGGGHSNIFSPAAEIKPHARPKYDQQNSSNVNFCMNTVDPNEKVAHVVEAQHNISEPEEVQTTPSFNEAPPQAAKASDAAESAKPNANLPQYHHHRSTALW